jgi:hypothetical protein
MIRYFLVSRYNLGKKRRSGEGSGIFSQQIQVRKEEEERRRREEQVFLVSRYK